MKIAVVGAGAMGSVYGGLLAEAGHEVYFLDVFQPHVDSINENGLWLEGVSGDRYIKNIKAATKPDEVGVADLVIVFVKSSITDVAMQANIAVVGDSTLVLTLQNGLGNIEKLAAVVKKEQIISGTTSHGANMLGPGRVRHAGQGATVIGELNGQVTERIKTVAEVFAAAKFAPVQISTNVMGVIWDKILVNVGINPLTAITGLRNGELLEYPETEWILTQAVAEAEKVAAAAGITLNTPYPVEHVKEVAKATGSNISSMLADINNHRKTEIDNINGAIVRIAAEHNIATPVNRVLTNLILLKEKRYNQ